MTSSEAEELYNKSQEAFKNGRTLDALALCEKAFNMEPENPRYQSFLGLCIARERGKIREAVRLCEKALRAEPHKVENYLNLGKVYLSAGLKLRSIKTFRRGLKIDKKNPDIIVELNALGLRKRPLIHSLSRDHVLNKYLGIVFKKVGFR